MDLGPTVLRDLHYVVLFVEDLERSLGFYRNTLGLEVRHRAEGYAELAVNGPKFALLERWRVPALVGNAEALRPRERTRQRWHSSWTTWMRFTASSAPAT